MGRRRDEGGWREREEIVAWEGGRRREEGGRKEVMR